MNRPEQSIRSTTRSASSVDIPRSVDRLNPELDRRSALDDHRPDIEFVVVQSLVHVRLEFELSCHDVYRCHLS